MSKTTANVEIDFNSRRKLLKMLGSAPLLPMSGASVTALLAACGGGGTSGTAITAASFVGMSAPTLAASAALGKASSEGAKLQLTFQDGSTQTIDLGYTEFMVTGDTVPKTGGGTIVAGGYFKLDGSPLMVSGSQVYSDCVDGSSLFTVPGAPANTVYAVVQFEYQSAAYGAYPSPICVLTLNQNPATGALSLKSYHNVDTSGIRGLWIPCGGSLSPWGTHLSSEEYMPDAFDQGDNQSLALFNTFITNAGIDPTTASPYHYGHLPEVTVKADGTGTIKKYFNQGRYSRELVCVFPDNKTLLGGDDSTNGGLFMFIADKAGDLSAGTLYVAKYTSAFSETSAGNIKWIKLGHATSSEIEAMTNDRSLTTVTGTGIKENGILYSTTTNPNDASFSEVKLNGNSRWVKLKAGQEKAAAFLETHRYAALKGGSLVFTKMEGTTVNIKDKVAYSAISGTSKSMVANNAANKEAPLGGGSLVSSLVGFPAANTAGHVIQHKLGGNQTDSDGNRINSDWVPYQSSVLIKGTQNSSADAVGNMDADDQISQPDNLKYSDKLRTLFIGEDSGQHVSNYVWAYELDTGRLQRVLSSPAGAECTGLQAVEDLNGWTYFLSGFQHAGEYTSSTVQAVKDAAGPVITANYKGLMKGAAIGYISGKSVAVRLTK